MKKKTKKYMELSKSLVAELFNIGDNMPVFDGDLQSHYDAKELRELGLAMYWYDNDWETNKSAKQGWVLTEKGKEELLRIKMGVEAIQEAIEIIKNQCHK